MVVRSASGRFLESKNISFQNVKLERTCLPNRPLVSEPIFDTTSQLLCHLSTPKDSVADQAISEIPVERTVGWIIVKIMKILT